MSFEDKVSSELELKIKIFDGLLILIVGIIYGSLLVGLIYHLVGFNTYIGFIHGLVLGIFTGVYSYVYVRLNNSFILPRFKSVYLWWTVSAILSFIVGVVSFLSAYLCLKFFQVEFPYFLRGKSYLFILALIIGIITALTGFLIYLFVHMRNREETYLRNAIEANFLSTLKLMNLHFLSNSLHTLLELTEFNPKLAEVFVKDLSQFFRKVLTSQSLIPLKDELNVISTYVEIERIRKNRTINLEQNIDHSALNILIPAFTLQPLLENAITHGLSEEKSKPLRICVEAKFSEKVLHLKVENDGRPITNFSPKAGLNLLQRRLKLVGGRLYLESKDPPRFVVEVPTQKLGKQHESSNS